MNIINLNRKGGHTGRINWIMQGDCIQTTNVYCDRDGYPHLTRKRLDKTIARWILLRRLGCLPSSIVSRHTCDNSWCVNPHHIIPGSHGDNNRDKAERGRAPRGERNHRAKLTTENVLYIRASCLSAPKLARFLGVSPSLIRAIRRREIWKHIGMECCAAHCNNGQ